ncbi:uncharacterized protein ACWYII_033836 isoform 2-T2 [Salvelinus alpinus]
MSLQQKVRECWLLRKGSSVDSDENEEELYAAGNMVIWSRGSKSHASHVYKAFTVGSPVVQIPRLLAELREVGVYSIAFEFSEGSPLSGPSFSASSSRRSLGPGPVPEGAVFPPPRARQSRERRKRILLVCASIRAWTLQGVESILLGCWAMLTPLLPIVVSSWLDVLWLVDHS